MRSKEFLNYVYRQIESEFPNSIIAYQFDDISNSHLIKVTPQTIYDSLSFMELESKLYDLWVEVTSDHEEDICFLSDSSLIQLTDPKLIYCSRPSTVNVYVPMFDYEEKVKSEIIEDDFYFDSIQTVDCSENVKFAMAA